MSVPHPGGDPNANLYAQLKRDVLDRVPQVTAVEYFLTISRPSSCEQFSIRLVLTRRQVLTHRN